MKNPPAEFWNAMSAIGTIFVGLVAASISVYQMRLQYRRIMKVAVWLDQIPEGNATAELIHIRITNASNLPDTIMSVELYNKRCFNDCNKNPLDALRWIVIEKVVTNTMQKLNPALPCTLQSRTSVETYIEITNHNMKHIPGKFCIQITDSTNRKYHSKRFTKTTLCKFAKGVQNQNG